MTAVVLAATGARAESRLATYFAGESVPQGHGRNIVNVILVDFRAMDTLGEITVLSVAAFGVFALLKLRPPGAPTGSGRHAAESGGRHGNDPVAPTGEQRRLSGPGGGSA